MDVFALLFIVSFLALVITLAVMHIRKHVKVKDNVTKDSKHIGWISDMLGRGDCSEKGVWYVDGEKVTGLTDEELSFKGGNDEWCYSRSYDLESSMMKREVNETQEKWKETLPKHSTRIKLRNSRKLRNKRKGKK